MKNIKLSLFIPILISPYAFSAEEIASCVVESNGNLKGSYNAIQRQAYDPSCVFQSDMQPPTGFPVVPIGKTPDKVSRIVINNKVNLSSNNFSSIELKLFGEEDNTLERGRGRQEIASCYLTENEFNKLPEEEKNFRRISGDVYHDCKQKGKQKDIYDFYIKFNSTTSKNDYKKWDSIVTQMHVQNDKTRYCIPAPGVDSGVCNQNNGKVATIERTVDAYNAAKEKGAIFESGLQPPISFRIKDGYFSIVLFSSLVDSSGNKTLYSPSERCNANVNNAPVGVVKTCPETGKTYTVAYRQPLDESMPANEFIHFNMDITWPSFNDNKLGNLKVTYINPVTKEVKTLVNTNGTIPFGTYDEAYPYFKAGIYRQNGNTTPTSVELKDLRRL